MICDITVAEAKQIFSAGHAVRWIALSAFERAQHHLDGKFAAVPAPSRSKMPAHYGTQKGGAEKNGRSAAKRTMLSTGPPMAHFTRCDPDIVPQFLIARAAQLNAAENAVALDSLVAILRQ